MAIQRVYLVGTPDGTIRLVKATIRSQALTHVANSLFTIRVASQDDLINQITAGIKVESVTEVDQTELVS